MGHIGINICDMCGKRTTIFVGKLVLQSYQRDDMDKNKYSTYSPRQGRTWTLCKRCHDKMMGLETFGDKIKEEIELKIDSLRLKNKEIVLLK